jgi:hypothetical protein
MNFCPFQPTDFQAEKIATYLRAERIWRREVPVTSTSPCGLRCGSIAPRHQENKLQQIPVPARDHSAGRLARTVRQAKKVSEIAPAQHRSGRDELTPRGQRSGATVLETLTADEGAFLIEMVVNGAVQGGELLQTSHAPEAQHRLFPSSE